jgi:hypothetical protein
MWRRRLFVTLSAGSLVLCLGFAALGVRTQFCSDMFFARQDGNQGNRSRSFAVYSASWGLLLAMDNTGADVGRFMPSTRWERAWVLGEPPWSRADIISSFPDGVHILGFSFIVFEHSNFSPSYRVWVIVVPYWFLLLITGLLPLRCVFLMRGRWRREKRLARGQCEHCGYDLRGTPDRCPECGAVP